MEEKTCCPPFDPAPWEGATHVWDNKLFITGSICQIMHMPLPGQFAKVIGKLWANAQKCGVEINDMSQFLLLSNDPSPWKSVQYMAVAGGHPDLLDPVALSGTFISKVFDGPFNRIPQYIKETDNFLVSRGEKASDYFFYYTTCPKCAKKYGHNYIVVFARIK